MDGFDALCILTCSILGNDGTVDSYGQKSKQMATWGALATNVPCRFSTDALGRPHEFKVEKESSVNYRRILLRVPTLSSSESLNPHHAILVAGIYYNIFEVLPMYDSVGLHHLEVIVEEIKA